jgi:hypothetical protein
MSESEEGRPSQVVIVRPGENEYDRNGIVQGALDVPLNATGVAEIENIKDLLWSIDAPKVWYASPTEPALQTALAIEDVVKVSMVELDGLHNVDFGLWQGTRWNELFRQYPRLEKCWSECPEAIRPPDGEAITDAVARVTKCLKRPLKRGISFGIVVPEPLAAIVRSVVTGEPLALPTGDSNRMPLVEIIPIHRGKRVLAAQLLDSK